MAEMTPPPPPPPPGATPPPPPGSSSIPPVPGAPIPPHSPVSYAPRSGGANLVDRAKNILITPKPEWQFINNEMSNPATVMFSYVLPMLFIGFFGSFIGFGLIGVNGVKYGAGNGLLIGFIFVIYMMILILAMGATIEVLAAGFDSEKNWTKSLKLAAYSMTAAYIGALFWLFPALWILVLLVSLYSLYALYTGIPILKRTPIDKQVAYFAVTLLITIVLAILLNLLKNEIIKAFQSVNQNQLRFG